MGARPGRPAQCTVLAGGVCPLGDTCFYTGLEPVYEKDTGCYVLTVTIPVLVRVMTRTARIKWGLVSPTCKNHAMLWQVLVFTLGQINGGIIYSDQGVNLVGNKINV